MAWLLACMTFYVPFQVCLRWEDDFTYRSRSVFWFEVSTDIAFSFDIFFNFFTAYHDPSSKVLICSLKLIALRYLKGFFILDLAATIPFGYLLSESSLANSNKLGKLVKFPKMIKFLRAVRLLKLLRVYKIQQFIMKLETEYNIHHGITKMIKIFSMVLLVTHLVACFWYLIGVTSGNDINDGGWMYRYDFVERNVTARYIASLYWAFSTLTTVGKMLIEYRIKSMGY